MVTVLAGYWLLATGYFFLDPPGSCWGFSDYDLI